ncbi:MAG: histidine--tRNA ligase [Propionibacteriaceae bacterium]|jgi:histidyl-tRNA synthetase|nr:histidine--tRNA ligase [Propionibacteriaceae bacterium]
MSRPAALSGFPEWLPAGRLLEQGVLDRLRRTFELHGFSSVETRAVEPLGELLRKGETSQEVYVLRRLQEYSDPAGRASLAELDERQLGLHFDLTVPFARYVLEHAGQLDFPFKRYQIQKVWRGERPQDGRFREFTQADIDVVGLGALPFHYEVELPLVMAEALAGLPIGRVEVRVNNRKLSQGFYLGLGLSDLTAVLRCVDKLDKIGPVKVAELLVDLAQASPAQAQACLDLAQIQGGRADQVGQAVEELARRHNVVNDQLMTGLAELTRLLEAAQSAQPGAVAADLKIARGLDYYTGSVYESVLLGQESLGSICSGGRYDSLASDGARTYPGVGLSIGVSRLVSRLIGQDLARVTRPVPTAVLVAVVDEASRSQSDQVAQALRARGVPTEVAPTAAKYGKQIKFADRRSIPYVWFPGDDGPDQVKDIRSGEQVEADRSSWRPAEDDLWPRLVLAQGE